MLIHHATLLGLQMEYITAGCSHKPSLMSHIPIKHARTTRSGDGKNHSKTSKKIA